MTVPFAFGPGNPFARDKTTQRRRKRLSVAELLAILPEHVLGTEEPERRTPSPSAFRAPVAPPTRSLAHRRRAKSAARILQKAKGLTPRQQAAEENLSVGAMRALDDLELVASGSDAREKIDLTNLPSWAAGVAARAIQGEASAGEVAMATLPLVGPAKRVLKATEKTIKLTHYSPKASQLKTLDPAFMGTGLPGAERARAGRPNALHYYMEGTPPEAQFKGLNKVTVEIPESKLIDIANPPPKVAKLLEGAKSPTEVEARLKKAGLYYYDSGAYYPEDLPGGKRFGLSPIIVKGFEKVKPTSGAIGPRAAATVMPGLAGAGVGASVGAEADEENRLRGALLGGAAGLAGGVALGHGADALGWKLRQGRINRAIDRAEEPNRAAMRGIMADEELLAAKRAGNERGAIGYGYQTASKTHAPGEGYPTYSDNPARYSALERFIKEGEFGRKSAKPLQQWLGYLRKNVGKGGYTKEELAGLEEGLLTRMQGRKTTQRTIGRKAAHEEAHSFTADDLAHTFQNRGVTLREDVFGRAKPQPSGRVTRAGNTLELLGPSGGHVADLPQGFSTELRQLDALGSLEEQQALAREWKDAEWLLDAPDLDFDTKRRVRRRMELADKILALKPTTQKKTSVDALPLSGSARYDSYRPKGRRGASNYREHVISAPELTGSSGFSGGHWNTGNTPNAIAHARTEDRGAKTLHVFELQSDWLQAARDKGIRSPGRTQEITKQQDMVDRKMRDVYSRLALFNDRFAKLKRQRLVRGQKTGHYPPTVLMKASEDKLYRKLSDQTVALEQERTRLQNLISEEASKVNAPPIPNETQAGVRMLTKSLLTRAAKEGYDKVSFARGTEVADMFNLRDAATKLELEPLAKATNKDFASYMALQGQTHRLKVTSKRTGQVRTFDVGPGASNTLEEYVGKGNAKLLREKGKLEAADFYDAGRAGIGEYYNDMVPQIVQSYVKELTGETAQWVTPKSGAPYLKMTPKLKAAILAGQVLPGLAGVALMSEEDRELLGIPD